MQPGSFDVPAGFDPAATVLSGLADAPWTHEVSLRIRADVPHIRGHLPAGIATLSPISAAPTDEAAPAVRAAPAEADGTDTGCSGASGTADEGTGWVRVRIRAERLDWIPPVLAALDRPFVIEHPVALRDLVRALAHRLDGYAAADGESPPGRTTA